MFVSEKHKRLAFLYSLGIKLPEEYNNAYSIIFDYFDVREEVELTDSSKVKTTCSLNKEGVIVYTRYLEKIPNVTIVHLKINSIFWRVTDSIDLKDAEDAEIHTIIDSVLRHKKVFYYQHHIAATFFPINGESYFEELTTQYLKNKRNKI